MPVEKAELGQRVRPRLLCYTLRIKSLLSPRANGEKRTRARELVFQPEAVPGFTMPRDTPTEGILLGNSKGSSYKTRSQKREG